MTIGTIRRVSGPSAEAMSDSQEEERDSVNNDGPRVDHKSSDPSRVGADDAIESNRA